MRERALVRTWYLSPDPLLIMLVVSMLAGVFLLLAGERLGFRATFRGATLPLEPAADFRLTDQFGKAVSLSQFKGGPVVLTFLYTSCPDTCPVVADKMKVVQEMMGLDATGVTFLAVSVDPEGDTPAAARAFAEKHGPSAGWYYLTGSQAELSPVWKDYAVGVFKSDSSSHEADGSPVLMHAAPVFVVDSEGYRRLAFSSSFDPVDVVKDLRLLMGANAGVPTVPFGTW